MNREDYEALSTAELKQCFIWIDDRAHPERARLILDLIAERENLPLDFIGLEDITKDHSNTVAVELDIFAFSFEQYSAEGINVKEKLARLTGIT